MKLAIPRLAILAILMLLICIPSIAQTGSYSIKPVTIPVGGYGAYPVSVNASNETVGSYLSDAYGATPTKHTFYSQGTTTQTLDGQANSVVHINNLGKITSMNTGGVFYGAQGTTKLLPGQPSGAYAQAGITDAGYGALTTSTTLYRYYKGSLLTLATFNPNDFNKTKANNANDNGYVVGQKGGFASYWDPNGTLVQVGFAGSNSSGTITFSQLMCINSSNRFLMNQQVQSSYVGGSTSMMALLGSPGVTALQQIPLNEGVAISNSGLVIGINGSGSAADPKVGVLYDSTTASLFTLNSLLVANSGWANLIPTAIGSIKDTIVGTGMLNGVQTAFIMQKIDPPGLYTFTNYWVTDNARINGTQRFKFVVQDKNGQFNNKVYRVFWRVNHDKWNPMDQSTFIDNSGHLQPDYEVDVKVSEWRTWLVPDSQNLCHTMVNFIVQHKETNMSVIGPDIPLTITAP